MTSEAQLVIYQTARTAYARALSARAAQERDALIVLKVMLLLATAVLLTGCGGVPLVPCIESEALG